MSEIKQQIYGQNFTTLLNSIRSDMIKWMNLPINFTGRINLFKMTWLPKFVFLCSTVPITPPKTFFKKAYSIITDFIWREKSHRTKRKVLYIPKLEDLELYHFAAQAFYLRHIVKSTIEEQWIHIKNVSSKLFFIYIFKRKNNKLS